jgi:hypothetical protein
MFQVLGVREQGDRGSCFTLHSHNLPVLPTSTELS